MTDLAAGLDRLRAGDPAAAAVLSEERLPLIVTTLLRYMDEIERFNPAYGLVKVKNRDELIRRHILDSLAPLGHIARLLRLPDCPVEPGTPDKPGVPDASGPAAPARLADAGSGAGLPGIPLGICLPGVEVTLIERMGRRANFLRNTLAALALPRIAVEEAELEK
ncbi:MAG: class I SAM-dependent methyltransferase, partial [Treponema sp.]|nr:class I SAM-dependent methyltransferase [Treponema sp.]